MELNDKEHSEWKVFSKRAIDLYSQNTPFQDIANKLQPHLLELIGFFQVSGICFMHEFQSGSTLFRSVNHSKKLCVFKSKFRNLASPPAKYTKELRMSRKGESVFYSSFDKSTTVKESVSSGGDAYTYICDFRTKRPMHLLDLTKISSEKAAVCKNQAVLNILKNLLFGIGDSL